MDEQGRSVGRPREQFDYKQLVRLANILCTVDEISSILGVSYKQLNNATKRDFNQTIGDFIKDHSAQGKASLRRKQYELAMEGSERLLMHLGRYYLGQDGDQSTVHDEPIQAINFILPILPGPDQDNAALVPDNTNVESIVK